MNQSAGDKTNQVLFYLFSSFFFALVVYVLFRLFKKPQQKEFRIAKNQPVSVGDDSEKSVIFPEELHKTNAVLFFGDFQIFNNKGDDITNKFTPLMKELFLLIWLHSVKDKGVSPEKITELFWFDKDEKSARNNLSVNIVKLKALTGELDTLVLSRQTGYWKMSFSNDVMYNDYLECRKISENKDQLNKGDILELISITQKGHFLESSAFEWLDEFKADISNLIIDTLIGFAEKSGVESDPDFILHLTDTVLHFEMLNEEAIQLKCRALTAMGKHNLAKEAFTKFSRDYKSLYNIDYGKTLTDLLNT